MSHDIHAKTDLGSQAHITVYLVDDVLEVIEALKTILENPNGLKGDSQVIAKSKYRVLCFRSAIEALAHADRDRPRVALFDRWIPGEDVTSVSQKFQELGAQVRFYSNLEKEAWGLTSDTVKLREDLFWVWWGH